MTISLKDTTALRTKQVVQETTQIGDPLFDNYLINSKELTAYSIGEPLVNGSQIDFDTLPLLPLVSVKINSTNTCLHAPLDIGATVIESASLVSRKIDSTVVQILVITKPSSINGTWVRYYNGTVFGAWKKTDSTATSGGSEKINPWQVSTSYTIGDIVTVDGVLYCSKTDHTSGTSTFFAETTNNWYPIASRKNIKVAPSNLVSVQIDSKTDELITTTLFQNVYLPQAITCQIGDTKTIYYNLSDVTEQHPLTIGLLHGEDTIDGIQYGTVRLANKGFATFKLITAHDWKLNPCVTRQCLVWS